MGIGKKKVIWPTIGIFIFFCLIILSIIASSVIFFDTIANTPGINLILQLAVALINLLILFAFAVIAVMLIKTKMQIDKNNDVSSNLGVTLDKNLSLLAKIDHNTHLSERAKAIVFREADVHALREIVFNKLHQKDFETTFDIIDEIEQIAGYKKLADALRTQATQYQNATETERENQVITHIEKLIESSEWEKARTQIEKLRWAYPHSPKVETITQKLREKRNERKKILLVAWDSAVQRQDTDRSIEILTELDQYLTPTEGLALQESARDVFRTKLHNLGVRFSLAVSEQHWPQALEVGRQIVRDFPNSRMSEEIRAKINILTQKVKQQV